MVWFLPCAKSSLPGAPPTGLGPEPAAFHMMAQPGLPFSPLLLAPSAVHLDLQVVSMLAGNANQPGAFLPASLTFPPQSPQASVPACTASVDSSQGGSARHSVVRGQEDSARDKVGSAGSEKGLQTQVQRQGREQLFQNRPEHKQKRQVLGAGGTRGPLAPL